MMGTLIAGGIIVVAVVLVIRGMIQDKKNGKTCHCSDGCGACGGSCRDRDSKS